jgi:outer membrane protein assembly factor BamA
MTRFAGQPARAALLAAAAALLAAPALAETTHVLDRVVIRGNHAVPTGTLLSALPAPAGSRVSDEDVQADTDALLGAYKRANVGTRLSIAKTIKPNGHMVLVYEFQEQAAPAPQSAGVVHVAPKLAQEVIVGNQKVPTSRLQAALALHPGDELSNEKVQDEQKRLLAVYQAAKVNANITGAVTQTPQGQVTITWKIAETEAPPPPDQSKKPDEGGVEGSAIGGVGNQN